MTKWIVFGIIQGLVLGAVAKLVYGRGPVDQDTLRKVTGGAA